MPQQLRVCAALGEGSSGPSIQVWAACKQLPVTSVILCFLFFIVAGPHAYVPTHRYRYIHIVKNRIIEKQSLL